MTPGSRGSHAATPRSKIAIAPETRESALSIFKIDFDAMEWQEGRPGVRHKVYSEGSRLIRLVEFATSEGDPHWCDRGHIGFVLAGGLEIDFNGNVLSFLQEMVFSFLQAPRVRPGDSPSLLARGSSWSKTFKPDLRLRLRDNTGDYRPSGKA